MLTIISVAAPYNCVDPSLIYDAAGPTLPVQTLYKSVLSRFLPAVSRVQLPLSSGVKLTPLYLNYFDRPALDQQLRTLADKDGVWFFNVFLATGVLPSLAERERLNLRFDISTTSGIQLPTDFLEGRAIPGVDVGHVVTPELNTNPTPYIDLNQTGYSHTP